MLPLLLRVARHAASFPGLVGPSFRPHPPIEGFFGRLKNEFFYGRDWSGVSTGTFIGMLAAYLRYYNEGRLKESLGWMSPMQFRRSLGLAT